MSTTLAVTTDELLKNLGTVMCISRTPADWDATDEADVRNIIRAGLRRFYHPPPIEGSVHQWRFLEKRFVVPAETQYSTGTVAISAGVVTLTGGTFPSWAADGVMVVDGINTFVSSRDGNTQVTLENTALDVDSGTSYTLDRWRKALPTNFGDFIGTILYNHADYPRPLRTVAEHEIRTRYATLSNSTDGRTNMVALTPPELPTGASVGTARGYFSWWPTMDTESVITSTYRAVPEDNLDNSDVRTGATSVLQSDPVHAQTMVEAILATAEEYYRGKRGIHHAAFLERLASSIKHDYNFVGPVTIDNTDGLDMGRLARLNHTPNLETV